MLIVRVACVAFISAVVAGCSASSYQKQVSELSDGLGKVKSSFETLSEDERAALVADQTRAATARDVAVRLPDTCKVGHDLADTNCGLIVREAGKDRPILSAVAVPNGVKLAGRIAAYGQGLVTLTESKDLPELKAATGKAFSAIQKLALDVKATPAEPLSSFVSLANWIAGEYFEHQRFVALREIVRSANPVIIRASKELTDEAIKLKKNIVRDRIAVQQALVTQLAQLNGSLKPIGDELAKSEANGPDNSASVRNLRKEQRELQAIQHGIADSLVADNLALQTLLKAEVGAPFEKMKIAHAELLKALDHPEIAPEVVFGKISDFIDQVEKLKVGIEKGRTAKAKQ